MKHPLTPLRIIVILLLMSLAPQPLKAQLNAADSVLFSQWFDSPRYCDENILPGNWYVHPELQSAAQFYARLDSVYKFNYADFHYINAMIVHDSLFYDTDRNTTFNNYPNVFKQKDPLTCIDFSLNGKPGRAYNYFFPQDSSHMPCGQAFLIVPGNGNNSATDQVMGFGNYNGLCFLAENLRSGGDVFTFMKPNEDARALYWNKLKMNHFLLASYLDSVKHGYGLNYLAELVATVKLLKQKYNRVVVLGVAEGGYATLLASFFAHPDGAVVSAGYSVGFDTSMPSYNVLFQKFDTLVSDYNRNEVKNQILANNTQYLFAWGNNDPVNLMQGEYDSSYTAKFMNDSTKISCYYQFTGHTFPQCTAIDSFISRKVMSPVLSFAISDTSNADTMLVSVAQCSVAPDRFDLYRNDTLHQSFNFFKGDTVIPLTDSGMYYLKYITSMYGDTTFCYDTIHFNKPAPVYYPPPDSVWFSQVFDSPLYWNDSIVPGNWYIHTPVISAADLYTRLDSIFRFSYADFDHMDSLKLNDTLFYDHDRNVTFNNHPAVFKQQDPLTYIDFTLNGKQGRSYNYFYPQDTAQKQCGNAFLIVPGNGNNSATELVWGYGNYNALCYVSDELRSAGDVFTMLKPNEDARALQRDHLKLNHFQMVYYLDSVKRAYGLNYLVELTATIKMLKQKYSKVVVLGVSEGGYATLLASILSKPDGAIISGGYSIGFDTSWASYSVLHEKFDSLLDDYDRHAVKNAILANNTQYLFAWGNNDPVNLMQGEHDSSFTTQFFNDSTKVSWYNHFTGHTFPPCNAIDSFVNCKVMHSQSRFTVTDTSNADTMLTAVKRCSMAADRFDVYRNDTLYRSFNYVTGDTIIPLADSGIYYLKNIISVYGDTSFCFDTIYFNKPTPVYYPPPDSVWFSQVFDSPRYWDDSIVPGKWYVHQPIQSVTDLYHCLDTVFKFSYADFAHIDSMTLNDTLAYDTEINSSFNQNPEVFKQTDPLIFINFTLNGKQGRAYNYFYPGDTSRTQCGRAFLVVPGSSNNGATELVTGTGNDNTLCFVTGELRAAGDVFTLMKPNEDVRAIHNDKLKMNHFQLIHYLDTSGHAYGLNYLAELIATVKMLMQKYSEVVVLGVSEGAYATLLASILAKPDGALISGGYSVGFDTSWSSYSVLRQKFDTLVSDYDRSTVKNSILSNNTRYLFAWGDNDPVNLMQGEHDFHHSAYFFNDSSRISVYYAFTGNTFPPCAAIDSFVNMKVMSSMLGFIAADTSSRDTMKAKVSHCSVAADRFELFRNDTLYKSFDFFKGDTIVQLADSGIYYLKNIISEYGAVSFCRDTLYFNKPGPVNNDHHIDIVFNNPVGDRLTIQARADHEASTYELFDLYGNVNFSIESSATTVIVHTGHLSPGMYFLKVTKDGQRYTGKVIKQ